MKKTLKTSHSKRKIPSPTHIQSLSFFRKKGDFFDYASSFPFVIRRNNETLSLGEIQKGKESKLPIYYCKLTQNYLHYIDLVFDLQIYNVYI